MITIHKGNGECPTLEEFAEQVAPLVGQPADHVFFAVAVIEEDLGPVSAMETYCDICELDYM